MIKVVQFDKPKPNEEVVEMLRDLLKRAEDGKLRDFAYCASLADGAVQTGATRSDDALRQLAAIDRLHHRTHMKLDQGIADPDD